MRKRKERKKGLKIKLKNEALREEKGLQKEKDETENNNERKRYKDTKNVKKKLRIRSEANKE
jgi:hypothetical protein